MVTTAPPPAPPPPAPVDPAIVAAHKIVERWASRNEELQVTARHIRDTMHDLETQRTSRENMCRDLLVKVQEVASPKPPTPAEPHPAGKPGAAKPANKKEAAPPPPPPPPPPTDEEDIKRQAKLQQALINAFKKKRDLRPQIPPAGAPDLLPPGEPPLVDQAVAARPPEVDPELWQRVLKLRDERIDAEDTINALKQSLETATARQRSLQQIEKLVKYALTAAQHDLKKAEDVAEKNMTLLSRRNPLAPPPGSGVGGVLPVPPIDTKAAQAQRPPSQLVAKR